MRATHGILMVLNQDAGTLVEAGWFYPAYFSIGGVSRVAARVREAHSSDRAAVLDSEFMALYSPRHLAAMLARYREVPATQPFCQTIRESFDAWYVGLTHVAVASLVPLVEGVIRRLADHDLGTRDLKNRLIDVI